MSDTEDSKNSDDGPSSASHGSSPDPIRPIAQEELGPMFFTTVTKELGMACQHAKLSAFFDTSLRSRIEYYTFILVKYKAPSVLPWHYSAVIPTETKVAMETTQREDYEFLAVVTKFFELSWMLQAVG